MIAKDIKDYLKIMALGYILVAAFAVITISIGNYITRDCHYETKTIPNHWKAVPVGSSYKLEYRWGYTYQERICE